MFKGLFGSKSPLIDFSKYLFLDLEYISTGQHIAEISIAIIRNRAPEVLFYQRLNPFGEPDFKINQTARSVCKIPLEALRATKTFSEHAMAISTILAGKTVVHWGGSDPTILRKSFDRAGIELSPLQTIDLFTGSGGDLFSNFSNAFPLVADKLGITSSVHCSRVDSLMLSCLFAKSQTSDFFIDPHSSGLQRFVQLKKQDIELFRQEKQAKPASMEGTLAKKRLKIYFTGFQAEKTALSRKYSDLGLSVMSSVRISLIPPTYFKVKPPTHFRALRPPPRSGATHELDRLMT